MSAETPKKTRSPEKASPETAEKAGGTVGASDAMAQRRLEGRANVIIASLLVLAIAVMANYLAFRHYTRWDWTSEGAFTLSPRTVEILHALEADVDVFLVMSSAEPNYADLRELLDRYRAESQHLILHNVDPDREPAEYELIRERFHLGSAMLADGSVGADVAIILTAGDRQWEITRDDLVSFDFDAYAEEGETRVDVRSEQALTAGVMEVTNGRDTKVCVTTGHGEWSLDGESDRDLSGLRDEMRRENLELEVVETRGRDELPDDCDAVLVVGPESAFSSEEAGMLRDHVRRGGNLLVALDPLLDRSDVRSSGLEDVLRDLGVRVDRTVVLELDGSRLAPDRPSPAGPFLVATYGDHPITQAFAATGIPMVVNLVRSVRLVDEDRGTVLLSTSDASFGEVDVAALIETSEPHRDDEDIAGPVSLAVAIEVERLADDAPAAEPDDEEEDAADGAEGDDAEGDGESDADAGEDARGRLVVIGDSDFLESSFMSAQDVVNYEVTSAMIGWLTQRQALIAIPPRRVSATSVRMTEDDVESLGFRVMVLMPLAAVFLGIAVWWSRRS